MKIPNFKTGVTKTIFDLFPLGAPIILTKL